MASIAVIGDGQSIQCFRSVGFATFAAPDGKTGAEQLRRAVREGYEIVFITFCSYTWLVSYTYYLMFVSY